MRNHNIRCQPTHNCKLREILLSYDLTAFATPIWNDLIRQAGACHLPQWGRQRKIPQILIADLVFDKRSTLTRKPSPMVKVAPVRATDEVIPLRTTAKTIIRGSPSLTRHPDNLLLTSFARSGSQGSSSSQCRDCLSIPPAHHASACLYPPQVATSSARFGRICSAACCAKCQEERLCPCQCNIFLQR